MRTTLGHDIATITSRLDNESVHVWLFDYQNSQRRAPLLKLLGIYLGLPPEDVVLTEGEHGRPELASPWNRLLQFNWSHSADKAIVAIARHVAPGIDIERVRPKPRATALAERFFHPEEALALSVLDDSRRALEFLRLWTCKEAVLKAMGRGVAFGLHRLRLGVFPQKPELLWLAGEDVVLWQLRPLDLGPDYLASVAWRGPPLSVDVWTLAESA
jgi:4'-phosphopantetheinyl transferase